MSDEPKVLRLTGPVIRIENKGETWLVEAADSVATTFTFHTTRPLRAGQLVTADVYLDEVWEAVR